MIPTTSRFYLTGALTTLLVLTACGESEERAGPSPAEEQLAEGVLTLEDVERFAKARSALAELAGDTGVARLLHPVGAESPPYASLEEAVAALESHPSIRSALADADLTAEDYVRTRFALQQALLAHDIRRAGGEEAPLPAAIPEENVDLVAEHRDRIQALLTGPPAAGAEAAPEDPDA